MRFVIGIGLEERHRIVSAELGDDYPYEVRLGGVAATGKGCDAALLSFPLALERYGGDPTLHAAQVLLNERGDGAPDWIVAIAPLELDADGTPVTGGMSYSQWVDGALRGAIEALAEFHGDRADLVVLVHLEGTGMDEKPLEVLSAVRAIDSR